MQRRLAQRWGIKTARKKRLERKHTTWAEIYHSWRAYALLAPIFFFLLVFMYYPPVLGLVRAFQNWAPGKAPVFVGFENFQSYFAYPETTREIGNMTKLLLFALFRGVLAPFLMAEAIFTIRSATLKDLYRLLLIVPMLAPGIVMTLLWSHIYDPRFGPFNAILGLGPLDGDWLGNPATALYAIMGVGFPWVAAVSTLIYMGGLSQISKAVYDSCLLDGCVGLRRVWYIDLPLVFGQVRLLTILAMIQGLTAFNTILILTDGGPGFATTVPTLTMYKRAFMILQFGYASAIGLMLFVIAVGLTFVINRSTRRFGR